MHVAQLLDSLALRPNVEVVEAWLPDGHGVRLPERSLGGIAATAPGDDALGKALFHTLHGGGRISHLRLAHEQMKVLGHDDVSEHHEAMLAADFFQTVQEQITALCSVEPRLSFIATASDDVEIAGAVVALETLGHEGDGKCASP